MVSLRPLSFAVGQGTFPIGFARLAVLVKELRGMPMQLGRLVVNGRRMLIYRGTPAPMPLVPTVRFGHNPRLSSG